MYVQIMISFYMYIIYIVLLIFRRYRDGVDNRDLWRIPHGEDSALSHTCSHLSGGIYLLHELDSVDLQTVNDVMIDIMLRQYRFTSIIVLSWLLLLLVFHCFQ